MEIIYAQLDREVAIDETVRLTPLKVFHAIFSVNTPLLACFRSVWYFLEPLMFHFDYSTTSFRSTTALAEEAVCIGP